MLSPVQHESSAFIGADMEQLLEKSLDDQFAMEKALKGLENALNRRLMWGLLPLGIAVGLIALYIDVSTRIAIPELIDRVSQASQPWQRASYDVFSLNLAGFLKLAPSGLIAGAIASWVAVWAGTYYRRSFIASMYVLIGLCYAALLTGLLGVLIPINILVLEATGMSITDAQIPHSDSISLVQGFGWGFATFSYVITGMERGIWPAAGMILIGLVGVKLAGGLRSSAHLTKALTLNVVLAVIALFAVHSGSLGIHQFLFDRLVQPPDAPLREPVFPESGA
jgi:hypothetical protein